MQKTLEALIIISTMSQLMCIVLLHAGLLWSRSYGPCYYRSSSYGTEYGGKHTDPEIDKAPHVI